MNDEPDEEGRLSPAEIVDGDGLDVIDGRLVEAAQADDVALTCDGGLLPARLSRVLSAGLEAELGEHLGYDRHALAGRNTGFMLASAMSSARGDDPGLDTIENLNARFRRAVRYRGRFPTEPAAMKVL